MIAKEGFPDGRLTDGVTKIYMYMYSNWNRPINGDEGSMNINQALFSFIQESLTALTRLVERRKRQADLIGLLTE